MPAIPHVCETLDFAHCYILYVYINCGLLTKTNIQLDLITIVTDNNITKIISQTILYFKNRSVQNNSL